MPDLGLFVIGGLLTIVVMVACILVGQQEAEDARRHASERNVRAGRSQNEGL
jgi:hypothetical protein